MSYLLYLIVVAESCYMLILPIKYIIYHIIITHLHVYIYESLCIDVQDPHPANNRRKGRGQGFSHFEADVFFISLGVQNHTDCYWVVVFSGLISLIEKE